jgi:Tol biopolymer transport system component
MVKLLFRFSILIWVIFIASIMVVVVLAKILPGSSQLLYTLLSDDHAVLHAFDLGHSLSVPFADQLDVSGPLLSSPDGQQIAFFVKEDTSNSVLYIANIDGTEFRHFAGISSNEAIGWLPDSQHFVALSQQTGELIILDVVDHNRIVQNIKLQPNFQDGLISPDGEYIAVTSATLNNVFCEIYVIDWRENDSICLPVSGSAQWSPDSQRLFVWTVQGGELFLGWTNHSQQSTRLADNINPVMQVNWSPDNRWLAVSGGTPYDIFLVDPTSINTNVTNLTGSSRGSERLFAWSPDGTQIAFFESYRSNYDIYIVDIYNLDIRHVIFTDEPGLALLWLP